MRRKKTVITGVWRGSDIVLRASVLRSLHISWFNILAGCAMQCASEAYANCACFPLQLSLSI